MNIPIDRTPLSVCVPAYNEEKLILECLRSISQQESVRITEILVGVNSSTDRTRHIVEEYARYDSRVKVIDSPKGKANAWNALNVCATNDIRIFQDGDSVVKMNAYRELLDALNGADIVGACLDRRLSNSNILASLANFPRRYAPNNARLNGCLYACNYPRLSAKLQEKTGVTEMPKDIVNDDTFLDIMTDKVSITDRVFASVEASKTLEEEINRYRRMCIGRLQLQERYPNLYQELQERYPELYQKNTWRFSRSSPWMHYYKLFTHASPTEKFLFPIAMTMKFFLFKYIRYRIRETDVAEDVLWK